MKQETELQVIRRGFVPGRPYKNRRKKCACHCRACHSDSLVKCGVLAASLLPIAIMIAIVATIYTLTR